jgi:replicative DNA helicase
LDEAFGGGFQKEGKAIYDIGGETNVGKAQPNSLEIYTPSGYKKFGELCVGDLVYGKTGKPIRITHIHPQGIKKVYKVSFMDGRSTLCCPEHLWTVWNSCKSRYQTLDTETIKFKIENYVTYKNRLQVPLCEPVEFPNDMKKLIIPPYLMGALLGDGGLSISRRTSFTNFDDICLYRVREELSSMGLELSGTRGINIVKKRGVSYNPLVEELERLGLSEKKSDTKFIPEKYIYTSVENRIALLEGMIDTDGFIGKNSSMEILLKNEQMINQLAFVVRSLGGNAKVSSTQKKYKGEYHTYYTLRIRFDYDFRKRMNLIPRKDERLILFGKNKKKEIHNSITKVELYSDGEECTCITVDAEDHLYLTNDFIVTHNSICLANIAVNIILQNLNVVIVSPEMSEMRYAKRISGMLTGIAIATLGENIDKYQRDINQIKNKLSSKLIIKEVPTKGVSAKNIGAYLKKIRDKKGFESDLICIDGHALLRPSVNQPSKHAELQFIVQECRGLSYVFEAPILTVAQLNRGSHKANNPGLDNMAGSWDQLADFDSHVNIWQTDEDREANMIRYSGKKVRDGAKGGEGFLSIDYDTLRLSEDSDDMPNIPSFNKKGNLSDILDIDSLINIS